MGHASQGSSRDDNRTDRRLRSASRRYPACTGTCPERRRHPGYFASPSAQHVQFDQPSSGITGRRLQRHGRAGHRAHLPGDGFLHAPAGSGALLRAGPFGHGPPTRWPRPSAW
ncbi:hypothetical protein G6F24_017775 [Rhizopus arrhizus]|nr:hypothetical protein G6F24_017775 [Rhizopus arrhizus]